MRKDRADFAKELGDKDGGVALLQRRGANLRGQGHAMWAGAGGTYRPRRAGKSERRWWSEERGWEQAARAEARGQERAELAELLYLWMRLDASDRNGESEGPQQSIIDL